jgi:acetylornithine aminotransferase
MIKVRKDQEFIMQKIALIEGVSEVRGSGLLLGIQLDKPIASEITLQMREEGILVNAANDSTIRIAPALNISRLQLNKFCTIFEKVMSHDN